MPGPPLDHLQYGQILSSSSSSSSRALPSAVFNHNYYYHHRCYTSHAKTDINLYKLLVFSFRTYYMEKEKRLHRNIYDVEVNHVASGAFVYFLVLLIANNRGSYYTYVVHSIHSAGPGITNSRSWNKNRVDTKSIRLQLYLLYYR